MRLADLLGEIDDAIEFKRRAMNYSHVYDSISGFMRPRMLNGEWHSPFDPYRWGGPYTEGNAIQYSWSVFHDVQGLVSLMGGKSRFISKLDSCLHVLPNLAYMIVALMRLRKCIKRDLVNMLMEINRPNIFPICTHMLERLGKLNIGFGKLWIVCIIQLLMVIAAMRIMDRHPLGICLAP